MKRYNSYPISLSGVPSGTGYYQQLLTINDPSQYGINTAGSNLQFAASNGSLLYAWIQSINGTSMQVWVKNYYGNSVIDMQVLPQFENLFSANGYLTEAPQLSSTYNEYPTNIFPVYVTFNNGNVYMNGNVFNGMSWAYTSNINVNSPSDVPYSDVSSYLTFSDGITIYTNTTQALLPFFDESSSGFNLSHYGILYAWNNNQPTSGDLEAGISLIEGVPGPTLGQDISNTSIRFAPSSFTDPQPSGYYTIYEWMSNQTVNSATNDYNITGNMMVNGHLYQEAMPDEFSNKPSQTWGYQFGAEQLNTTTYKLPYFILTNEINDMPTYSIGTSSIFQANATTSSTFSGASGLQYNSTYQYFTYDIPLAPSTNYVTVIWNSTWLLSNAYPSTFLPVSGNFITFEDLQGFGSIEVQLIEPSSQINKMEQVQLSPYQQVTNNPLDTYESYFQLSVSYVPFQSSSTVTVQPSTFGFSLPFGSNATASVYSPWHQLIGSQQFLVDSDFVQVNIPLNVTFVTFIDQQTNASFSGESISSNGYNNSFPDPMVVVNGSSYSYGVSAIDPQTYQLENYPGIFTATGTSQKVYVNVGMPLASALINVYAYNGSGLGELGNGGPSTGSATAYLYIGGVRQSLSSTFTGELGQTYPVVITDVLGNVLYRGNLTLNQPSKTVNINIGTPSYAVQFVNGEDVPASSPLAIQFSSINAIGNSTYYNFTTRVGQESTIYLATGEYHLYTHDNLTDSLNFSLTNETIGFDFNGPNILAITESAINDTNHGIIINPISQPGSLIPGQNATWLLEPEFKNGTILTPGEISNSTLSFLVTNSTGAFIPELVNHTIMDGYLKITFLPTVNGSMTFSMKETYNNNSGSYSYQFAVTPIQPVSVGLREHLSVPPTVQVSNSTVGTITFSLTSGSSVGLTPTAAQTDALIANSSVELLYHGSFSAVLLPYYDQPGVAAFSINVSSPGTGYSILVITHTTNITGQSVRFTGTSQEFSVSTQSPSNPPQPITSGSIEKFLTSPAAIAVEFIATVIGLLAYLLPKVDAKKEMEKADLNQAELVVEGGIALKILAGEPLTVPEQAWWNAIPEDTRKQLMREGTAGKRVIFPHPVQKKKEVKNETR